MKIVLFICRIILGLFFIIVGLDGFFTILPTKFLNYEMTLFIETMERTDYFLPTFYGVQILAGLLVLVNFAVTLASLIMLVIIFNFIMLYLFLVKADPLSAEMTFFYFLFILNFVIITTKARNYLVLLK